jgi:hypothetical protein
MSQQIYRRSKAETEPLYNLIWNQLKRFPKVLSEGAKSAPTTSGPAAAAIIIALSIRIRT